MLLIEVLGAKKLTPMIKNPKVYRKRSEKQRWDALSRLRIDETLAIGEALLTSEIMKIARFRKRRRPMSLAIALGIEQRAMRKKR